eukprot:CAMPEP_0183327044 /NCGR_PEP_ID=MMETSP0160_2-20130417/83558_1 /TAXON_ID=2839 ORGANISM="Odontella Sinensis, Strain Grunow 1884" /NCGR_SAMPLE_ID=MMETSP0160_2 /ASSEMBLY_ACC=CAM_ASM_000250 /LENGTH=388 /DNA_ID=CAMNT_0025495155 /DNA_START=66 /DNA_END=1232 /DNA_ORIENTATION=-
MANLSVPRAAAAVGGRRGAYSALAASIILGPRSSSAELCTKDTDCRITMPPCGPRQCQCVAQPFDEVEPCQEDGSMMFGLGCPGEPCPEGTEAICILSTGLCDVVFPPEPCGSNFECQLRACPSDDPQPFDEVEPCQEDGSMMFNLGCPGEPCPEGTEAVCIVGTGLCDVVFPPEPCGSNFECQLRACPSDDPYCDERSKVECVGGECVYDGSEPETPDAVEGFTCAVDDDCRLHTVGCGVNACTCIPLGIKEDPPVECVPGEECICAGCVPPGPCAEKNAKCIDGACGVEKTNIFPPPPPVALTDEPTRAPTAGPTAEPTDAPTPSPVEEVVAAGADETDTPTEQPSSKPTVMDEESGGNALRGVGGMAAAAAAAALVGIAGLQQLI